MIKNIGFFNYNKNQRNGLLLLFVIIISLQLLYFFASYRVDFEGSDADEQDWLSYQEWVDSVKSIERPSYQLYPFNPNFISDFKGYQLGMSVEEIDRLHEFRKQNKYVNSVEEFQKVTGISDSLLSVISPYFKFPDWIEKKKPAYSIQLIAKESEKITPMDINSATQEDLIKVRGIGEKLSERILKFRESLGAFVSMEQLHDVYGLSPEVIEETKRYFFISDTSTVKKIKINELSVKELGLFPYFKYPISKNIVVYRSMNGEIKKIEDLLKIQGFPIEKIEIIALYLEF